MSKLLRVLDLFSGIGGFTLGLERTGGFKTVAFCEIEEFPRRVLAKHWPDVPVHHDVRELKAEHVNAVDVICGGFPCQDISTAGKGAGLAGERSGLWSEYARLVGEIRPRYVIVENVAALLGRGVDIVLGDLASRRYDAWWDCIRALDIGAPHLRDRLWIVAYAGGQQHESFGDALGRSISAQLSQAAVAYADSSADATGLDGGPACCAARGSESGNACQGETPHGERVRLEPSAGGASLAHADSERSEGRRISNRGRFPSADIERCGPIERGSRIRSGGWWATEPDVGRVAHGVPSRVDRLRGLGNAVVPQIPEIIGRAILKAERLTAPAVRPVCGEPQPLSVPKQEALL